MSKMLQLSLCAVTLFIDAVVANASPHRKDSPLLRLVPGYAQLVSGISDPGTPSSTGRLLLVTENNNRDFDDCLALLGVDQNEAIDEIIQAAASSSHGDLSDHLLLLAGRFDDKQIFHAAMANGASSDHFNGRTILVLRPFQREENVMRGVRWIAILNNHLLVFGVPRMVADALNRYQLGEAANSALLERLGRLPTDDNSWTLITMPRLTLAAHLSPSTSSSAEAQLTGVNELEIGIHYARMARIDFSVHSHTPDSEVASAPVQLILASLTRRTQSSFRSDANGRISGSISIREREFDWQLTKLRQSNLRSGGMSTRDR